MNTSVWFRSGTGAAPLLALLAAGLLLAGCDQLFTDPAPAPPALLAVSYTPEPQPANRAEDGAAPRSASVYALIDRARIRVIGGQDNTVVLDTVVPLSPDQQETRVRLSLPGNFEGQTLLVSLELLDGNVVVATGVTQVVPEAGATTAVSVPTTITVDAVRIAPAGDSIVAGTTRQLSATVLDRVGNPVAGRTVTWRSGNDAVATVSSTGLVTAVAPGTVQITATAEGKSASVTLRVTPVPVASVTVAPDSATLSEGQVRQFSATLRDAQGNVLTDRTITWSSSDTAVARVDGSGLVTAVGRGTATITATSGERSGSATVRVVRIFAAVAAGAGHGCYLDANGQAYCWGSNTRFSPVPLGPLGHGGTVGSSTPVAVAGAPAFSNLEAGSSTSCALTTTNQVYCWGENRFGQIGDGTRTNRLGPVLAAGGRTFASLSVGWQHTCGLTAAGEAFCWGANRQGQLGTTATETCVTGTVSFPCSTTPQPVSGGLTFRSISAGLQHTCGVTTAGEAYCWGWNAFGQLGTGAASNTSSPAPVRVATTLAFATVSSGATHTCTLTAAGEAYCWGYNQFGQVGDGTFTQRPTPVRVADAPAFVSLGASSENNIFGHTCGITAAGAVYCWGGNDSGQLGTASTGQTCSFSTGPVSCSSVALAVAGLSGVRALAAGLGFTCARTAAARPLCWGSGQFGTLGNGTLNSSPTPVSVLPPTPVPVVQSVTVTPSTRSIAVGDTVFFDASARDQNGNAVPPAYTWTSSDTTVATVSGGRVIGVGAGTATLTATMEGVRGTATVTVAASSAPVLGFQFADPVGDTLPRDSSTTSPQPALDLRQITGRYSRTELVLTLHFTGPVRPASEGVPNSLLGFVEFDVDENSATGPAPRSNNFGATALLGVDYELSFFAGSASSVLLSRKGDTTSVSVAAQFSGDSVTVTIPFTLLGGDDGNFQFVAVFGPSSRPTDLAPNQGAYTARRPTGVALINTQPLGSGTSSITPVHNGEIRRPSAARSWPQRKNEQWR